ncbi:hypothetical protein DICVIV_06722 [Dictyocaulus viviparus]|uniref:Uncharacterized protein n=1 Tax=Dictyocaulus viviparus TaxID=29172 RepID=A0A0D8XRS0_DICVI|nr:hypothetical protein DICVIV_06722 [Dictyocaulus viviparus]
MDFMRLLDTANKNAKNVSKKLDDLKTEVDSERRAELKRIEEERIKKIEILKRKKSSSKPSQEVKKFVIPKKKKDVENDDKAKVLAYLAKKSEEERQLLMQKKAEKERLIQLRLQAHGGKEEQDRLATQYRDGVYKALAQRRKLDEKIKRSGASSLKQTQHSSSMSNNQISMSRRDQSSSNKPFSDQLKRPKLNNTTSDRKVKTAPAIGFSELMKAAQDIAEGKDVRLVEKSVQQTCNEQQRDITTNRITSSNLASKKNRVDGEHKRFIDRASDKSAEKSSLQSSSTRKPANRSFSSSTPTEKLCPSSSKSIKKLTCEDLDVKDRKDQKGRFKKGPTPPPLIPQAVPGKRYLPGDIRYKQAMEMAKQSSGGVNSEDRPGSSKLSLPSQIPRVDSNRIISTDRERPRDRPHIYPQMKRDQHSYDKNERFQKQNLSNNHRVNSERHGEYREHGKKSEQRHNSYKRAYSYDDLQDEEYDDEYDSEMEDFIDDSGLDMEELSRQEFEETLKMVNPKYNKKKWRERERKISLKDMHADYRTIAREEARSARIGLIEDLQEATKGKSEAL